MYKIIGLKIEYYNRPTYSIVNNLEKCNDDYYTNYEGNINYYINHNAEKYIFYLKKGNNYYSIELKDEDRLSIRNEINKYALLEVFEFDSKNPLDDIKCDYYIPIDDGIIDFKDKDEFKCDYFEYYRGLPYGDGFFKVNMEMFKDGD